MVLGQKLIYMGLWNRIEDMETSTDTLSYLILNNGAKAYVGGKIANSTKDKEENR